MSAVEWLRIASRKRVVLRALRVSGIVGLFLIAIHQGDVLLSGELDARTFAKVLLTPLVPYLVSTFSSVATIAEIESQPPG